MNSNRIPIASLIVVNLCALFAVRIFEWNLFTLVMLYWTENIVVGILALPKMVMAKKKGALGKSLGYQIIFYIAHYSTFIVMHLAAMIYLLFPADAIQITGSISFPALAFLIALSHGLSFKQNFLDNKESQNASALKLSVMPYRRVIPAHILLALAALLARQTALSTGALQLIVAIKIAIDLLAHRSEHASLNRSAQ